MNIKALCREYTDLSEEDMEELEQASKTLQTIAELVDADVFIDCLTEDKDKAIVVAEAKPLSGKSIYDKFVVGRFAHKKNEPAALRTLNRGIVTRGLKATTQENNIVIQHTVPIRNKSGKVIAVLIIEQNPDELELKESDILFKPIYDEKFEEFPEAFEQITKNMGFITENINNSIVIFSSKGTAVYANAGAKELYKELGYMNDISGLEFDSLVLDDKKFEDFRGDLKENDNLTNEVKIDDLYLEVKYNIMKEDDELIGINMIVFDITERKEKEKELILKSVVIKEIHHRVKNNLQTIMSLLRLQSRRVDDPHIKVAFDESISRISSIAIIHELLAKEGISDIYMKDILINLKDNILRYIERPDLTVDIELLGDDFIIDSDSSTSIALIINELIQNSIDHGFKNRKQGKILIDISSDDENIKIKISDDGVGFDVEEKKDYSLGLKIVEQLVYGKLDGRIDLESNHKGTDISIIFKNK